MTDTTEQRRSKQRRRRVFRRHAYAFIPVAEWWPEIPWYPGSVPTKDEISVTEMFEGPVARVEAMSLVSCEPVEAVIRWYLDEMQRLGWLLLSGESRVEQVSVPDHRRVRFSDDTGLVRVEIQVKELGKYPAVPAKAPPEGRRLLELFEQKWKELDEQVLKRVGQGSTDIFLSRSQRRSADPDRDVAGAYDT
jgi:hypothetical protein